MQRRFFLKKPVQVEALQWLADNWLEVNNFVTVEHETYPMDGQVIIGDQTAEYADWIVKTVEGAFIVVKPDIFEQIYDQINP